MNELQIHKATLSDIDRLQKIGKQTFSETFGADNRKENMTAYLEKGFSTDKLKSELADPDSEFYFAVMNDRVIGYLKINFGKAQTEIRDNNSVEIERIYVLKEYHGKKVGRELFEKSIKIAKEKEVDYVWLGVWEKNTRAIKFYEKNGFVAFDKHSFKLGEDEQTDIMMKLSMEK